MANFHNIQNLDAFFYEIYGDADKFVPFSFCKPETPLGVYAFEDAYLNYLGNGGNGLIQGRGLDTPFSHSSARSFKRPFIGPVFELDIPNVGRIGFYIPCTHIKIDEDIDKNDIFFSKRKNREGNKENYYGLNEIRHRLLLTTTGILDFSDPSVFKPHQQSQDYKDFSDKLTAAYKADKADKTNNEHGNGKYGKHFRAVALNLLEGLCLDQMIPAYNFCVHEYKIPTIDPTKSLESQIKILSDAGCDIKIPYKIGPDFLDNFKRIEYMIESPGFLLSITDKLRDLCEDYYIRKMIFLTTGHLQEGIQPGSNEYYNELKALLPGISIWDFTAEKISNKFEILCPVDKPFEQNLGLNFTIALMECLVSARYLQNEVHVSPYRIQGTDNLNLTNCPVPSAIKRWAAMASDAYDCIDDDRRQVVLKTLYAFETGRATQQDIDTIREVLKPCKPIEHSL